MVFQSLGYVRLEEQFWLVLTFIEKLIQESLFIFFVVDRAVSCEYPRQAFSQHCIPVDAGNVVEINVYRKAGQWTPEKVYRRSSLQRELSPEPRVAADFAQEIKQSHLLL